MNEQKHTPAPWMVDPTFKSEVQTHEDKTISSCWHEHAVGKTITLNDVLACPIEESAANAARIVACVNALEGIDDPAAFMRVVNQLCEEHPVLPDVDEAAVFREIQHHLKGNK